MAKTKRKGRTGTALGKAVRNSSKTQYKNHFLKQVIVRIDLANDLELTKSGPGDNFVRPLSKTFPVKGVRTLVQKQFILTADEKPQETVREATEWNYQSKSGDKKLTLGSKALIIEYTKHESYETLKRDFLTAHKALTTLGEITIVRLGLRYVNHVELTEPKPTKWESYLRPELLASFKLADDVDTVSRSFTVLEFSYPDDTKLRFSYGMSNPDYPSPIKQKLFILDFDAHCDMIVETERVQPLLDIFHDRTSRAFEQVIKPALRRKMGEKK